MGYRMPVSIDYLVTSPVRANEGYDFSLDFGIDALTAGPRGRPGEMF